MPPRRRRLTPAPRQRERPPRHRPAPPTLPRGKPTAPPTAPPKSSPPPTCSIWAARLPSRWAATPRRLNGGATRGRSHFAAAYGGRRVWRRGVAPPARGGGCNAAAFCRRLRCRQKRRSAARGAGRALAGRSFRPHSPPPPLGFPAHPFFFAPMAQKKKNATRGDVGAVFPAGAGRGLGGGGGAAFTRRQRGRGGRPAAAEGGRPAAAGRLSAPKGAERRSSQRFQMRKVGGG